MAMSSDQRREMFAKVKESVLGYTEEYAKRLPSGVPFTSARFVQAAIDTVQGNPDILGCFEGTIYYSIAMSAADGLLLDGKQATLQVKNKKRNQEGEWQCAYTPMVKGRISRMRRSKGLIAIEAHCVYTGDEFYRELGSTPKIVHSPCLDEKDTDNDGRGQRIGVYAMATFEDRHQEHVYLTTSDIDAIKSKAATQKVWDEWPGEMWKKAAVNRLYKWLDTDSEPGLVEGLEGLDELDVTEPTIGPAPDEPEPEEPTRRRHQTRGEAAAQVEPEPESDPEKEDKEDTETTGDLPI